MIKTVVFRLKTEDIRKHFIVALVPFQERVDTAVLAEHLKVRRSKISAASQMEIQDLLGFPVGGVAPTGFSWDNVVSFVDASFFSLGCNCFYMGAGDNTKTLKVSKPDFVRMTHDYIRKPLKERRRS